MRKITVLGISLGAALLCAVPVSLQWSPLKTVSISVDKAEARIGRPLTPGSIAGVHRRVERSTRPLMKDAKVKRTNVSQSRMSNI